MKRITVENVLSWGPCEEDYPEAKIHKLAGKHKSMTALQILDLKIPTEDRFWVILREEVLPEKLLHVLACDYAAHVVHIYERRYPEDKRPRQAIETKWKWIHGEATDGELSGARAAAWAAWAAAWDAGDAARAAGDAARAAWAAAWAAWAAAWDAGAAAWAARDAAWDAWAAAWGAGIAAGDAGIAAGDAEEIWQVKRTKERIREWYGKSVEASGT